MSPCETLPALLSTPVPGTATQKQKNERPQNERERGLRAQRGCHWHWHCHGHAGMPACTATGMPALPLLTPLLLAGMPLHGIAGNAGMPLPLPWHWQCLHRVGWLTFTHLYRLCQCQCHGSDLPGYGKVRNSVPMANAGKKKKSGSKECYQSGVRCGLFF